MKIFVAIISSLVYWLFCFLGTGTEKKTLRGLDLTPTPFKMSFVSIPSFAKSHIASFLRGIPMFAVVALFSAELVMLFGR